MEYLCWMVEPRAPPSRETHELHDNQYFIWNDCLKGVNSQMGTRYYMTVIYMRDMDPSWKSDVCWDMRSMIARNIIFVECWLHDRPHRADCMMDCTGTPRLWRLYSIVGYSFVPRPPNMKSMRLVGTTTGSSWVMKARLWAIIVSVDLLEPTMSHALHKR